MEMPGDAPECPARPGDASLKRSSFFNLGAWALPFVD